MLLFCVIPPSSYQLQYGDLFEPVGKSILQFGLFIVLRCSLSFFWKSTFNFEMTVYSIDEIMFSGERMVSCLIERRSMPEKQFPLSVVKEEK